MKTKIHTESAPQPAGPYSQAIVIGPWIFVSGQGPSDPVRGTSPVGLEAQTHQVLRNLQSILRAAGADMGDVAKVTAHLADMNDFEAYNAVYQQYFVEPYPARITVGSQLHDILVEIDVIAYRE